MIKSVKFAAVFLSVFIMFADVCGQTAAPTPIPTPMPQKSPEIEAKEIARDREYSQKQSTALSRQLFVKNGGGESINVFLISHRFADRKIPPAMEVCFDYIEYFSQNPTFEESRIFSLYLYIDDNFVMFPLPEKDVPPIRQTYENDNFYKQIHHFKIYLTDTEAIALGNAARVSVKWNKGSFEVGSEGFAAIKKFYDEEMPKNK